MTDTQADQSPPPPSARRLYRSRSERVLAGVCGGLAEYTGIDPVVFRVGFAVASLMGGAGLFAYFVAALLLPDEDALDDGPLERLTRGSADLGTNVLLLLVAVVMVPSVVAILAFSGNAGLLVPLAFFGMWIVMIQTGRWPWWGAGRDHEDRRRHEEWREQWRSDVRPGHGPGGIAVSNRRRPRRRDRDRLRLLTVSAAMLAGGTMAWLQVAGLATPSPPTVMGVLLLIVAAGLLVGSVLGNGRRLVGLGIVLGSATLATTAGEVYTGGFGNRSWRPRSVDGLGTIGSAFGNGVLDLTDIRDWSGTHHARVGFAFGNMTIRLPRDVDVELDVDLALGNVDLPGSDDGRRHAFYDAPGDDRLVLQVHGGLGNLEVTR